MSDARPPTSCSRTGPDSTALACGADAHAVGEIVFTTSMSGYQEAMTDPSYAGQLIAFTFPRSATTGSRAEAMESDRIHARAAIMRAARRPRGRAGRRARLAQLARATAGCRRSPTSIRARSCATSATQGAMRGGVFPAAVAECRRAQLIAAEPGDDRTRPGARGDSGRNRSVGLDPAGGGGRRIAMIDTGVKLSIVSNLVPRGATVELHPCTRERRRAAGRTTRTRSSSPTGPVIPAALDYIVETVRELVGKLPVYGICLGHQLLCRAVGLETYKLPFGHHGANHPVKDLTPGGSRSRARTTASLYSAPTARRRSTTTRRSAGRRTSAPPS